VQGGSDKQRRVQHFMQTLFQMQRGAKKDPLTNVIARSANFFRFDKGVTEELNQKNFSSYADKFSTLD